MKKCSPPARPYHHTTNLRYHASVLYLQPIPILPSLYFNWSYFCQCVSRVTRRWLWFLFISYIPRIYSLRIRPFIILLSSPDPILPTTPRFYTLRSGSWQFAKTGGGENGISGSWIFSGSFHSPRSIAIPTLCEHSLFFDFFFLNWGLLTETDFVLICSFFFNLLFRLTLNQDLRCTQVL